MFFNYDFFEDVEDPEKPGTFKRLYKPLRYATGERIKPCDWTGRPDYKAKRTAYDYLNLNTRLANIKGAALQVYSKNKSRKNDLSPEKLKDLLDIELERKPALKKINLNKYLDNFIKGIKNGSIETADHTKFKYSTIRSFEGLKQQFDKFQQDENETYDFEDITVEWYEKFVKFFNDKNYSRNTIGKHIKSLKNVMQRSYDDKLHLNNEMRSKKFKAITGTVHEIYLTHEDIQKLTDIDLSENKPYEIVRDVFLVGYYTAQRYSDYSRLKAENIREPEKGRKEIDLVQQKTGERVIIPFRNELERILKKYDYNLPKTIEQKVNKYIKEIAKDAGINENIIIPQIKGGKRIDKVICKADMIKTHTARRSGATNLFLEGVPTISIMKITGHKTEKEFMKYVLVSKEENAKRLSMMPEFNGTIKKTSQSKGRANRKKAGEK